uniref:Bcl2-like protein n=1 Tax=Schmidtea mediterranea TaxID=79327 RepID=C9WPR4_SCHMD|nr:bcl2-like protein [Schmidtea mediterranea]
MSYVKTMTLNYDDKDYIHSLLNGLVKLAGIDQQLNDRNCLNDDIVQCLHSLVVEAQDRGKDTISNFSSILNKPTDDDKKQSFYIVVESLFNDCIRWSRVIVAFMYIIQVLKISKNEYKKYFEWSVELILTKIYPWVRENGGWEQIVQISKNRNHLEEVTETMKQFGKVALGITGLFALGKWIFN